MPGKNSKPLDAIVARLEAVVERLDRLDREGPTGADDLAPAMRDQIADAARESLDLIFGPVDAALIAGDSDRMRLVHIASNPIITALVGKTPPAQQLAATRAALFNFITLLVGRLADLRASSAESGPLAS